LRLKPDFTPVLKHQGRQAVSLERGKAHSTKFKVKTLGFSREMGREGSHTPLLLQGFSDHYA